MLSKFLKFLFYITVFIIGLWLAGLVVKMITNMQVKEFIHYNLMIFIVIAVFFCLILIFLSLPLFRFLPDITRVYYIHCLVLKGQELR